MTAPTSKYKYYSSILKKKKGNYSILPENFSKSFQSRLKQAGGPKQTRRWVSSACPIGGGKRENELLTRASVAWE